MEKNSHTYIIQQSTKMTYIWKRKKHKYMNNILLQSYIIIIRTRRIHNQYYYTCAPDENSAAVPKAHTGPYIIFLRKKISIDETRLIYLSVYSLLRNSVEYLWFVNLLHIFCIGNEFDRLKINKFTTKVIQLLRIIFIILSIIFKNCISLNKLMVNENIKIIKI